MAIHFSLAFAESCFCIAGNNALHLAITADEAATDTILYGFELSLRSTNGVYSQSLTASMPSGKKTLTVPVAIGAEWAQDFVQNIGDPIYPDACGRFYSDMVVHYTMYAGHQVFAYDYKGYSVSIPGTADAALVPSVGALSAVEAGGRVPAAWGKWVQGLSVARITAQNACGTAGSSIAGYDIGGTGVWQTENVRELALADAGNVTVPVSVIDSRERRAAQELLLYVEPYAPPSLSGISSRRCDAQGAAAEEGACFRAVCSLSASTLNGLNPVSVQCAWKKVTETGYGAPVSVLPGSAGQVIAANLEKGASYDVKYTVSDTFSSIEYFDYVSSAVYLLHFLKGGTGIAVGKAAEQPNRFDVGLESVFRRSVSVGGALTVAGTLSVGGQDVTQALSGLAVPQAAAFAIGADINSTGVYKNRIVRCGHVVTYQLMALLADSTPCAAGDSVTMGTIPAGWFDPAFPPALTALQSNFRPCSCTVLQNGQLMVTLSGAGETFLHVYGTAILES